MFFVSGIDPLGTVSGKEIFVVFQSAHFLYHRDAFIFGDTRINGGLIDHDVSFGDHFPHGFTGSVKGAQIGIVVLVHRGGYCHYIEVAITDRFDVGGAAESVCQC
jgi:hypothetical protein